MHPSTWWPALTRLLRAMFPWSWSPETPTPERPPTAVEPEPAPVPEPEPAAVDPEPEPDPAPAEPDKEEKDEEMPVATEPETQPELPTIPDRDVIDAWHPQNYHKTEDHPWGKNFFFTGFTGRESEPTTPKWVNDAYTVAYGRNGGQSTADWDNDLLKQLDRIRSEVDAAWALWRAARWQTAALEGLREIEAILARWRVAQAALDKAYGVLWDTPDDQWRSTLMRLMDARTAALEAARELDGRTADIDALDERMPERVLEILPSIHKLAEEIGVDLSLGDGDERWEPYVGFHSYTFKVEAAIRDQDRRIREVYALAGEKAPI